MHLLSDVRVGAFLSGGIDSSTIAAMMAQHTDGAVPVFSIGVKEQAFNELPYARLVADRYGMEAHEQVVSADLIHLIPKMIRHMDEPSDPYGVGVYLVSKLARKTVKDRPHILSYWAIHRLQTISGVITELPVRAFFWGQGNRGLGAALLAQ